MSRQNAIIYSTFYKSNGDPQVKTAVVVGCWLIYTGCPKKKPYTVWFHVTENL